MSNALLGSLYFIEDPNIGPVFGIRPYDARHGGKYRGLSRRIRLSADLGWREVEHVQTMLRKSDIWGDFPFEGATLVRHEFKPGDEDQRIDLLFIRSDCTLYPCELKVGGTSKDTHGQLLRYLADLHFTPDWTVAKVRERHAAFMGSIKTPMPGLSVEAGAGSLVTARHVLDDEFNEFLARHELHDGDAVGLYRGGALIDEEFPAQLVTAVRYLNDECAFDIRLVKLEAFTEDDWTPEASEMWMRIDLVDVTPQGAV